MHGSSQTYRQIRTQIAPSLTGIIPASVRVLIMEVAHVRPLSGTCFTNIKQISFWWVMIIYMNVLHPKTPAEHPTPRGGSDNLRSVQAEQDYILSAHPSQIVKSEYLHME